MSVLIITEQSDSKIKKQSLEAISYGVALAKQLNLETIALVLGSTTDTLTQLGNYGVKKVIHQSNIGSAISDNKTASKLLHDICTQEHAQVIIFSNSLFGKAVAPRLSVKMKAGLVTGVIA